MERTLPGEVELGVSPVPDHELDNTLYQPPTKKRIVGGYELDRTLNELGIRVQLSYQRNGLTGTLDFRRGDVKNSAFFDEPICQLYGTF